MMPYVIRIMGLVNGGDTEYDGQYLKFFDPGTGEPGECVLDTVPSPHDAKQYADLVDARAEWMRLDPRMLWRPDGQPNRPLTAFSITIDPLPQ